MKNFRYDIALIRFICIAIVVYFHAYCMTFANHLPSEVREIYRVKYDSLTTHGLINLAMPMFVFISGFLFGGQLMRKQPISFGIMIKGKFMRLMVPFFVFTIIFMLTTNSVSWKPFYQWTYLHLWFLPMLFWCFIFAWLLRPFIMSENYWVSVSTLLLLFGVSLIGKFMQLILGLQCVHRWLCWFALGAWFFNHEKVFKNKTTKISVTIGGAAFYILLSILFPQEYGTNTVMSHFISLCGMAALWCGINLISFKNNCFTSMLVGLSGASFGIYIFHNWIEMYLVSATARRVLPIDSFAMNHTILFPFLFSTIAFAISYVLSYLLLKTKIGKRLIG